VQPDPVPGHPTPGMHLWGWMSPAELEWLHATAATMRSVVEIGSLHGRSSFALATGCPGPVYCIDPWNDAGWVSFTRSLGHLSNVHPIRAASPGAGDFVPGPVDMVFIDGAHDYDSVLADVLYWDERVEVLLCGHDYVPFSALGGNNPGFPDVRTVVDMVFGDRVRVAPDTAIWCVDVGESSP
jgi:hypothetical protein